MMTAGSLFDGIGGFMLAAARNGITPLWLSEIEPNALKVTAKYFPDVPNVGDITLLNGADVIPVDIYLGGTPCQSFSIAGSGEGLANADKSGLFFHFTRVAREMYVATGGNAPRHIVWENVKNALACNKGKDFLTVLNGFISIVGGEPIIPEPRKMKWEKSGEILGKDGAWSLAWRVMDAQFYGVAQRRERIALVMDLNGANASNILFEVRE